MSNPPTANPLYQPDVKLPQMQAQTHAPPPSHVAVHPAAASAVATNGTSTGTTPNPIGIPAVAAPILPPTTQNISAGAGVATAAAPGVTMVSAVPAPPVAAAVSSTVAGAPVAPPQPKEEYEEIREQVSRKEKGKLENLMTLLYVHAASAHSEFIFNHASMDVFMT